MISFRNETSEKLSKVHNESAVIEFIIFNIESIVFNIIELLDIVTYLIILYELKIGYYLYDILIRCVVRNLFFEDL